MVPALGALRSYGVGEARADFLAGLTVAAVAVPQAMAYAMVAGLPAEYGLYTAIVMTAVGAVFSSSRQLINGPTNAISIAVLSVLAAVQPDQKAQAAILLACLVGAVQLVITLFRLALNVASTRLICASTSVRMGRCGSCSGSSSRSTCIAPLIPASGFLISCAKEAASWPISARCSARVSWASTEVRSN